MDILKNIFSGGTPDNYEQRHQQYQTGYQGGNFDNMDNNDVFERYQRTVQHAPPDVLEQAHQEAFNRLPPNERQQIVDRFRSANADPGQPFNYPGFTNGPQDYEPGRMGNMVRQAQQQQPDLLQQILGPGGALSNPMAKAALAGVAAIAAQRMMGGGGGLAGGLLGGLGGNRR